MSNRILAAIFGLAFAFIGCDNGGGGGDNPSSSSSEAISSRPSSSSYGYSSSAGGSYNPPSYSNTYRTVQIGSQVWMAENLNYNASGSKCYDNKDFYCTTYGRLYDWATAMAFPSSCNSNSCDSLITTKHQGICPTGWHIPTNAEWDKLYRYVDGTNGTSSRYDSPAAGKHLKTTSGWSNCGASGSGSSYACYDTYGFAALPGGIGYSDGNFYDVGDYGSWWSASENGSISAYFRRMYYYFDGAYWSSYYKTSLFSVRCVKD